MGRSRLENSRTFQNFVTLYANRVARQAALEFSHRQDSNDHVLLITGNVGVGKTHLAQACMNEIQAQNPDKAILNLSFERVLHKLSINEQGIQDLDYLDACSVIHIDSYYKSQKTSTCFLNRSDQFWDSIKQTKAKVLITSTVEEVPVPCKRIELVHEPEKESVRRVVEMKLSELNFKFSDEVIEYISTLKIYSIREIENLIVSLQAKSMLEGREIDLLYAPSVVQQLFGK